jgi:hypothetical protein
MVRHGRFVLALVLVGLVLGGTRAEDGQPRAELSVEPSTATVGDRLRVTLSVELPPELTLDPRTIGPRLGAFTVFSGEWGGPVEADQGTRRTWSGTISAFKTGSLEIPSIRLELSGPDGPLTVSTDPVAVEIVTVLENADPVANEGELADLKPPASVDPDYGPLTVALLILGVLLVVSVVLWWLHRRYASRLAAVAPPEDPFHRKPPHEWVYEELRKLLDRRLAEQGRIDEFYSELSRILKRYLGGRYRLDLMEHTTDEIAPLLEQVGAAERPIAGVRRILDDCDRVKFAKERPGAEAWRAVVESVYEIVDETKPAEALREAGERGVA